MLCASRNDDYSVASVHGRPSACPIALLPLLDLLVLLDQVKSTRKTEKGKTSRSILREESRVFDGASAARSSSRFFARRSDGCFAQPLSALFLVLVTYALDGDDVFVADLLPQFANVDVDRAVADHYVLAPYAGVDLLAREEPSRIGHQQRQQRELLARQGDLLPVAFDDVTGRIDRDAARIRRRCV